MLKRLDKEKLADILDKFPILREYCSGESFSSEQLLSSMSSAAEEIRSYVLDEYTELSELIITPSLKNPSGADEQRLVLGIQFRCSGIDDKYSYSIHNTTYDKLLECLVQIFYLIVYGEKAIALLNSIISMNQSKSGSTVGITYKWGISDKFCRVVDWNYDWLYIRLNKAATIQLVSKLDDDTLENLATSENWDITIRSFIENFNSKPIHCTVGAVIDSENVETLLQESMLSADDAIAVIRRSGANSGIQTLKTVEIVKELGRFIAICEWTVDYSKKTIAIQLDNNKVYDADKDRFIGDHDIVDRVLDRLSLKPDITKLIFEDR